MDKILIAIVILNIISQNNNYNIIKILIKIHIKITKVKIL
jgi:hypothetical protein